MQNLTIAVVPRPHSIDTSYLGAGVAPYTPTWGNIMGEGRGYLQVAVWITFFPGLLLSLTVLAANLVGDGLRDLLDPRLRRNL